jgi:hypothetical protein
MNVIAHTLPMGSLVDGLLGMDFLASMRATLRITEGILDIPW